MNESERAINKENNTSMAHTDEWTTIPAAEAAAAAQLRMDDKNGQDVILRHNIIHINTRKCQPEITLHSIQFSSFLFNSRLNLSVRIHMKRIESHRMFSICAMNVPKRSYVINHNTS